MKCARCGNDIEQDMEGKTNICGSCADDLRNEENARLASYFEDGRDILTRWHQGEIDKDEALAQILSLAQQK